MKIGVQILAYNCHETLDRLLEPWLKVKKDLNIKIWIGSGQFKLYKDLGYEDKNSKTIDLIKNKYFNHIDFLWTPGENGHESDQGTRTKSIEYFNSEDIDLMWVVDSDEFYTENEIRSIYNWVLSNKQYDWYSINFKNLIGDTTSFIDFEVARISWYKRNGGITGYYFDCHFMYGAGEYGNFYNTCIPTHVANPLHFTWTNNLNSGVSSKDKIYYQNHFYNDGCSFKVNELGEIEFNKEFYESHGLQIPKLKKIVNLVLSTSRRLDYFSKTIESLVHFNPDINNFINKVYILDDRSSKEDRNTMEQKAIEYFGKNKVQLVTFNSDDYLDYIDKLNFIRKICDDIEYIFYLEDDWISTDSLDIKSQIIKMNTDNIDILTFSENYWLQNEDIKAISNIDDYYWSNPYPEYFKHTTKLLDNGNVFWTEVKIKNFTLNPSLIRKTVFLNSYFNKVRNYEFEFSDRNNLKQQFTKISKFIHIGDNSIENS